MVPNGCDPDGHVDRPSLETDLAFWREQKFVENDTVEVADVVDDSFVDAALKTLGPYKPVCRMLSRVQLVIPERRAAASPESMHPNAARRPLSLRSPSGAPE